MNDRYVAFLRGMNLGNRRIRNDELCAFFADMGFDDPAAFLASGNVVFDSPGNAPDAAKIGAELERQLEYPVDTFIRSAADARGIASHQPFSASQTEGFAGKCQVAMLTKAPENEVIEAVLELQTADDLLAVHGSELYWLPRGGVSESELDFKAIERLLGTMTVRTQRTLERVVARFLTA